MFSLLAVEENEDVEYINSIPDSKGLNKANFKIVEQFISDK